MGRILFHESEILLRERLGFSREAMKQFPELRCCLMHLQVLQLAFFFGGMGLLEKKVQFSGG